MGVKKPDRRIFEAVLEALDTHAADAVYVGDHPVNDVQGATEAGLTAIWLRGWQDWPADDLRPNTSSTVSSKCRNCWIALATRNAATKLQPRRSPVNDSRR